MPRDPKRAGLVARLLGVDPSRAGGRTQSQAGQGAAPDAPDDDREARNRRRRRSRRVKATLSIALALAAGTFLSCQRALEGAPEPERRDEPPRAPPAPAPAPAEEPATTEAAPERAGESPAPPPAESETEPAGEPAPEATPGTAIEPAAPTALERRPRKRRLPVIDRQQHRTGMPVPDNLLE